MAEEAMSVTICLSARTIDCSDEQGGHVWMYLNWALGLRSVGCRVIWLELLPDQMPVPSLLNRVRILKGVLGRYGLDDNVALASDSGGELPAEAVDCLTLEAATTADLLLNQIYEMPAQVVARFRRSALLDSDPGLLQYWIDSGYIHVATHDVYFTIGERLDMRCGIPWEHTNACAALDWWPVVPADQGAPFTTVSNWTVGKWVRDAQGLYRTDKRSAFLPFLAVPAETEQPMELALYLSSSEDEERATLQRQGWRVRDSRTVAQTPWEYQRYIQTSRGEFSCAKPSYVRMGNAWMSDRTLCYLASGKPAVVQHTGPSSYLPDAAGLFRFRDPDDAVKCLETVAADYPRQCRLAREVAEEFFDAKKVFGKLLERALN
jgi:hypothetical protein